MEQKKTLWIALSSGIFLLVVLGAALVIYAPGSKTNSNAFALRESGQVWTASLPPSQNASQGGLIASEPGTLSGTFTPSAASKTNFDSPVQDGVVKTDSMTVYSEQTTFYTTGDVNSAHSSKMELSSNAGTVSSSSRGSNVSATNSKGERVLQETGNKKKVEEGKQPAVSQAFVSSNDTAGSSAKTTAAAKSASAPATASAAVSKTSGASKTTSSSTATQVKSASSGASTAKTAILPAAHYWIQVASYSTKDNADEARNILDAKDLPCEVFTFTKNSKLYYRVRVGPYKTESEAERWKKSIDSIDLFKTAQSYIVDSSARASR